MGSADDKERKRAYHKEWVSRNRERYMACIRASWQRRKALGLEDEKKSYYRHRESRLEHNREFYRNNKSKYNARVAARKANKLRATPSWANHQYINDMYVISRLVTEATGIKHHVDHIVPMISPLVCGLHVEANLQVVEGTSNLSKANRYWPDMPE